MRELQTGVWHWEAPHPGWKPGQDWDQMVSSYAIDDGDRLLLFDPLAPPSEVDELAARRETAIVLTCPWHRRDAHSLAERLGAAVHVPPPDEDDPNPVEGQVFREGDRPTAQTRACRPSRSSKRCARCSSCRSSWCSQLTVRPPTEAPSSARSDD